MIPLNPRLKYLARQMRNAVVSMQKRVLLQSERVFFGYRKADFLQRFGMFQAHAFFSLTLSAIPAHYRITNLTRIRT
jgi:hypothetical protein